MREGAGDGVGASSTGGSSVGGSPAGGAPAELSVLGPDRADASCLLLTAPDGTRYRLRAGSELRAALRQLGPATGSITPVAPPLRPRDIQAKIRAGESAVDVAAAAGVPVEQVRRYEGPVLAERAHVALRAREARLRHGDERVRLVDLVRQRLTGRGVDPETVAWDAWRREGGRWAVQAAFRVAGRDKHAQWHFDVGTQALDPLDDEARWLCAVQEAAPRTGRRLSSVRVYDVEDDGGVRDVTPPEASARASAPAEPAPAEGLELADPQDVAERTMELLDALRERRGRRMPVLDLDDEDEEWGEEDEDDLVNALLDLPPAAHPPASAAGRDGAGEVDDEEPPAPVEPRLRVLPPAPPTGASDAVQGPVQGAVPSPAQAPAAATTTAPAPAPAATTPVAAPMPHEDDEHEEVEDDEAPLGRGRRRPSVPSWDEILFGSPRLD